MKHPKEIEKYDGSLGELAKDIGMMTYDSMGTLLKELIKDLEKQSKEDQEKGRGQLVEIMCKAIKSLSSASDHIDKAWEISEPHIGE